MPDDRVVCPAPGDAQLHGLTRRRLATALALLTLGGCAATSTDALAPAQVSDETAGANYRIGPLDALQIVVWRNPELSAAVTVRPDGRIAIPLVDDLDVAGRSPADVAREIERRLGKFILDPVVNVIVAGFQGVYADQIRIVGEAARPQAVPYRRSMTILDVMIQVGGMTDFADGNRAVLVRGSQQGKQYRVRLNDLLRRGDISANVPVLPGDIVIIPQSWF